MSNATNGNAISPMVQIDFTALGTAADVLSITEKAFLGHVNIRGSASDAKFMAIVEKALGVALPIQANTYVTMADKAVLWLSPDEWLVVIPEDQATAFQATALESQLREDFADLFASVNDVSGGNTILEISGDKAQAILLKGCPLDLHHSVFSTGQCAQTVLAKTSITLWQTNSAPTYNFIVRRSFSDYLGLWLLDAAKEYR